MKTGTHYPVIAFGLGTVELCRRAQGYGHALHYCGEIRRLLRRELARERKHLRRRQQAKEQGALRS